MDTKIVGVQILDFVTKEGEKIAGMKIHYAYKEDNVSGMAVDTVFVRDGGNIQVPDGIVPNGNAVMHFNRKGKLTGLQAASVKPAK